MEAVERNVAIRWSRAKRCKGEKNGVCNAIGGNAKGGFDHCASSWLSHDRAVTISDGHRPAFSIVGSSQCTSPGDTEHILFFYPASARVPCERDNYDGGTGEVASPYKGCNF